MNDDEAEQPVRVRVANACDTCKARKGEIPNGPWRCHRRAHVDMYS